MRTIHNRRYLVVEALNLVTNALNLVADTMNSVTDILNLVTDTGHSTVDVKRDIRNSPHSAGVIDGMRRLQHLRSSHLNLLLRQPV